MEMFLDKEHLAYYNQDLFAKIGSATLYDIVRHAEEGKALEEIIRTKQELLKKHPDNTVLKNTLSFFLFRLSQKDIKTEIKERHKQILLRINNSTTEVAQHTLKKIKKGSTLFVHSINNQVREILLYAAGKKNFLVNMVEHRPFLFGQYLAKELNEKGIKTNLFPDIALEEAIKGADLCLIGGEAITKNKGAMAKEGSSIASETAKKHNIPTYVCATSFKYNKDLNPKDTPPVTHTKTTQAPIVRATFDHVLPEHISAYICEYGVFRPEHIQEEIKFYNGWMFI